MELLEAMAGRRAVRAYTDQKVDHETVKRLIEAATLAPSAINDQPWAFVVVEDVGLVRTLGERAKAYLLGILSQPGVLTHFQERLRNPAFHVREMLSNPAFNIFYGAGVLIVVCATRAGQDAAEDCCLAAQNLMLAAYGSGLATCPIGFARPWLNLPEVKRELGIPDSYVPVMPVIVGYQVGAAAATPRREPEIICVGGGSSGQRR